MSAVEIPVANGLKAFMANLIDYAGLFPPARLPLDEAFANYVRYRRGRDSWLLGRFIIPAARLADLSPFIETKFDNGDAPLSVSALGRGGSSEFLDGLAADLTAIAAFRRRHGPAVAVDLFEVRLPPLAGPALQELVGEVARRLHDAGLSPFFEATTGPATTTGGPTGTAEPATDWETAVAALLEAVKMFNGTGTGDVAGFKLRCGGLTPADFPTVTQVARVIAACRDGVRFKATAGLHHPVRWYDSSIPTYAHGFLNLFGAAILANLHQLDREQIERILKDEDGANFRFTEDGFAWGQLTATKDQIHRLRQYQLTSFGSCSFDEPREDLRALGLMLKVD